MKEESVLGPKVREIKTAKFPIHTHARIKARSIKEGIPMSKVIRMLAEGFADGDPRITEYILDRASKFKVKPRSVKRKSKTIEELSIGKQLAEEVLGEETPLEQALTREEIEELYDIINKQDPLEDI